MPEPDPFEPEDGCRALEDELRSWHPAAPSPLLRERIREAAARGRSRPVVSWLPWAGITVAAAAGLAIAFLATGPQGRPTSEPDLASASSPASPEPGSEDETVWLNGEIQVIVELPDGPPMWRVRYETVRRTAWSEPDGTSRQRFVPEERLLFVPVSYQ